MPSEYSPVVAGNTNMNIAKSNQDRMKKKTSKDEFCEAQKGNSSSTETTTLWREDKSKIYSEASLVWKEYSEFSRY